MEIISHSYRRHGSIEFIFDRFPLSRVLFYPIKNYYFIKHVKWNPLDPEVKTDDLEEMQLLVNEFLGCIEFYKQRKAYKEKRTKNTYNPM
ncbi:hypothetical protein WQ54_29990 [Bacillus sp. SA1-12]|uniref:hypothetical protein n=1 Tax=Bacillus sp. SA1-12 TaxID=1455638 RepID=UPI000627113C|nr:hypothetical protein [Bacillus sp. SA1-12]KKI88743.1 hypothetical protein WQ54_29990 [Bacillus sp. SA1-12]